MSRTIRILGLALAMTATASAAAEVTRDELQRQVMDTERAFARTMADRNFDAFITFLSPEAVFISGGRTLRGNDAVAEAWKPYFDQPQAPFSWQPGMVEVLDSGSLALSSGPVSDPGGQCIGTFTSIWRLEAGGAWKIVFDKGSRDCPQ